MSAPVLVARKPPIVCDLTQGSSYWLLWREAGLGSSDAPAIMGVSPWLTPLQLWELKTRRREPQAANAAMQRGTDLEVHARREFEFEHGGDYPPACLIHSDYPFLKASLDGYNPGLSVVVEIKCPGKADHALAQAGTVPPKYMPQVQHLLLVSGADHCWYVSYDPDTGCEVLGVDRDEPYLALLLERELAFWECVQTDTPPPESSQDVVQRSDPEWDEAARDYRLAYSAMVDAEADLKAAREALLALAGGHRCEGAGVKVTPFEKRGALDWQRFKKDVEDVTGEKWDTEPYRKPATTEVRVTVEQ